MIADICDAQAQGALALRLAEARVPPAPAASSFARRYRRADRVVRRLLVVPKAGEPARPPAARGVRLLRRPFCTVLLDPSAACQLDLLRQLEPPRQLLVRCVRLRAGDGQERVRVEHARSAPPLRLLRLSSIEPRGYRARGLRRRLGLRSGLRFLSLGHACYACASPSMCAQPPRWGAAL